MERKREKQAKGEKQDKGTNTNVRNARKREESARDVFRKEKKKDRETQELNTETGSGT